MTNLKTMLMQEQIRLEKILTKTKEQLKDVPPGTLRLTHAKESVQFYHHLPGGKSGGQYILRTNTELVRRLAQKSYDKKILKQAERRLNQIRRITRDYDEEEIEKIFWQEHKERQKLIQPAEPLWEQQLETWMAKNYEGKGFQKDSPMILTEQGERVRSKSEKILADCFYRHKIPYKYEHPLYLKGYGTVYPDFTFLSRKNKREIYWEHHGMMDDPSYAESTIQKIQAYERNDIYPGEQLILTFETGKLVLDMEIAEKLMQKYLL